MRKYILSCILIAVISPVEISAKAAPVLRKSALCDATEKSLQISENLVGIVFDDVLNELGYGVLTSIANNTIYQYRDMILRPQYYADIAENLKVQLEDYIFQKLNSRYEKAVANA